MKNFSCPYNNFDCSYVNSLELTKDVDCDKCVHYHNGVRATGAMPVLGWLVSLFRSKNKNKTD